MKMKIDIKRVNVNEKWSEDPKEIKEEVKKFFKVQFEEKEG